MSLRNQAGILALVLCGLAALSSAALAGVVTYTAGGDQISSVGVLDIAEDNHGVLYFGTENGLSFYDGRWHIIHRTFGNATGGLLSEHVLAVEVDGGGTLWIGQPNGLQRVEGGSFLALRDQQLLKALDIHGLLRRGDEMWVAAGNAGLHRYWNGTWKWFRPGGPEGLGCNYVTSMASDPATGTLYAACREGIWYMDGMEPAAGFTPLDVPGLPPDSLRGIRGDPFGGLYVYNTSAVLHFSPPGEWELTVTSPDLLRGVDISDIRVGPDETLWIATNNGIYAWRGGVVAGRLDAFSGTGSNAIKRIYIDSSRRLWFVTPENIGYATIEPAGGEGRPVIPVTTFELPKGAPVPVSSPEPPATAIISVTASPELPVSPPDPLSGFLRSVLDFFGKLFGGG